MSAALRSGIERRILYALTLAPAVKGLDHGADLAPLLEGVAPNLNVLEALLHAGGRQGERR